MKTGCAAGLAISRQQRHPSPGLTPLDFEARLTLGRGGHLSPPSRGCPLSQGGASGPAGQASHIISMSTFCVLGPPGLRAGGWAELVLNLGCRIQVLRSPKAR